LASAPCDESLTIDPLSLSKTHRDGKHDPEEKERPERAPAAPAAGWCLGAKPERLGHHACPNQDESHRPEPKNPRRIQDLQPVECQRDADYRDREAEGEMRRIERQ